MAGTKKGKKSKSKIEAENQRKRELIDIENKRIRSIINQRWLDSLQCLSHSVIELRSNPWLIIQSPEYIHNYLDSLTEVLSRLSSHHNEIDNVRHILQSVYEAFVDIGKFVKYQPSFYISNRSTLKRFVRLLEQVSHRGSDKALLPNVLSMLGPTFERIELHDILYQHNITHSLLSFARNDWLPTPGTLSLLLAIIEQLSYHEKLRQQFINDNGWNKFIQLAYGELPGLTREQQMQAQQALQIFPDISLNGNNNNNNNLNEAQQLLASMNLDVSTAIDNKVDNTQPNVVNNNTTQTVAG